MASAKLRLVAIDGLQVAPAPRKSLHDEALREEREVILAIMLEHLGYFTQSLARMKTLTKELEVGLGISLPEYVPVPRDFDGLPDHSV